MVIKLLGEDWKQVNLIFWLQKLKGKPESTVHILIIMTINITNNFFIT